MSDLGLSDRNMWPPAYPNAAPSETESRALTNLLEDQQRAVAFIEGLRKRHDAEHQDLSYKATMLKETLNSLETLKEKGSKLRSDSISFLDASSKELLHLRAKTDFLQPLFTGTMILLDGLSGLSDAIQLLRSTLETSLGQLENFLTGVAREFYSTEMLCAQTTNTIASFSSTSRIVQQSIALMQNGAFHPLRRLPEGLLVQIFDCCADEEAQKWVECSGSALRGPKVLTRIAGVCSRWRSIAHSHPELWRRLLAPESVTTSEYDPLGDRYSPPTTTVTGTDQFYHALQLLQGAELDLTIPTQFKFPPDLDINELKLERLNLLNANEPWPPIFPSPKHLLLSQPTTKGVPWREIPLSLVSDTSKITSSSVSLTFASPAINVTHLVLCGQHLTLPINTLLRFLPQLIIFDAKDACGSHPGSVSIDSWQLNTHFQLRTFGVDGSRLAFLEEAVFSGLRLPNLRVFEIANIDWKDLATKYPLISTHMSPQITHLGLFGTDRGGVEALRKLMNSFHRLDTLSLHGAMTEPVLQALYRGPNRYGANGGSNYLLPNSVQRVAICDYHGDGEAIYQRLYEMRADAATNGNNVKIIFKDCLNIRPDIRKKCCSSLVVQQRGGVE